MWKLGCVVLFAVVILILVADLFHRQGNGPQPGAALPAGKSLPAAAQAPADLPGPDTPTHFASGALAAVYPLGQDPDSGASPFKVYAVGGFAPVKPPVIGIQVVSGWIKIDRPGKYNFTIEVPGYVTPVFSVNDFVVISPGDYTRKPSQVSGTIPLEAGMYELKLKLCGRHCPGTDKYDFYHWEDNVPETRVMMARAGEELRVISRVYRDDSR